MTTPRDNLLADVETLLKVHRNPDMKNALLQKIASECQMLPKEPPLGLLHSMALRLRHDFGLLTPDQQKPILADMRRLYDEVSGNGFFEWENVTGQK